MIIKMAKSQNLDPSENSTEHFPLEALPVADESQESNPQTTNQQQLKKHWSSEQTRILISSCILQLPIWGFVMSYGVVQDYYTSNWTSTGKQSSTGVIGTTFNGIIYISMPLLFAAFTRKYARYRKAVAFAGAFITCVSYLLAAFCTDVWQLIATQGVIAAIGSGLIYTPCNLSLGEWFSTGNRALAYGLTLSSKNIVGSASPFLLQYLLNHYGYKPALLIWAALTLASSLVAILLMPSQQHPATTTDRHARTSIPWHFLKHRTFYIYSLAILLQSSGYGLPQTYLTTYAHDTGALNPTSATLLLTLFNLPGILSSSFFGWLSDAHDKTAHRHNTNNTNTLTRLLSIASTPISTTLLSSLSTSLSALLLWGLAPRSNFTLLILFSIIFGFFAGGYSGTWGGVVSELESEAARHNEALDSGLIYGLLNGARGVGYVGGGLVGLALLNAGAGKGNGPPQGNGYETEYWAVILFTGISTVFGGAGVFIGGGRVWRKLRALVC